jgi:sensor histidine kinase YesM
LIKKIYKIIPSAFFGIVFSFWTIIGIIIGTAYLSKSPPPEGMTDFYLKGFAISMIIAYLNVAEFQIIHFIFKKLKRNNSRTWKKIFCYSLFCIASLLILWFIRFSYSTVVFSGKELTTAYIIESFKVIKALSYDGIFFFILNLFIIYIKEYYDLFKEGQLKAAQLEVELMKSQLEALKIQIHPHFLFNTLHLIASLIRDKNNDLALKMTTSLSNFLRYTLNNHSQDFVSLEQEMEMIYLYFQIQEIRFQDRLRVNYNIENDAKNAKIPNMILQPLVENSIRHGISKRLEGGNIDININRVNGKLSVIIKDDGPGFSGDFNNIKNCGIGLKNTISRLERCYKNNFTFNIDNDTSIGTKVIMEIPFESNGSKK